MSKEGTPVPILSYKKGLLKNSAKQTPLGTSLPLLPPLRSAMGSPVPGTPTLGTPTLGSARKVSSRRKALQEFYNLQEAEARDSEAGNAGNAGKAENGDTDHSNVSNLQTENSTQPELGIGIITSGNDAAKEIDAESLSDPAQLEKFVQTATVEDMLKLRNRAANKLNHHDVEKKSIIYDNYYELIKLSQVLSDLDEQAQTKNAIFDDLDDKVAINDKYVENVLGDLNSFLRNEGSVFNQDFELVVENIRRTVDDADSVASVRGISAQD